MSLNMGIGLRVGKQRRRNVSGGFVFDPDALDYIQRVELADGEALEQGYRLALNDLCVGLKTDGLWAEIGYLYIRSGARSFAGSLEVLKGPSPTNVNYVSGDYNRRNGVKGNKISKHLDSNFILPDYTTGENIGYTTIYTESIEVNEWKTFIGSEVSAGSNRAALGLNAAYTLIGIFSVGGNMAQFGVGSSFVDIPITGQRQSDKVGVYSGGTVVSNVSVAYAAPSLHSTVFLDALRRGSAPQDRSDIPIRVQLVHKALSSEQVSDLHSRLSVISNHIKTL